MRYAACTPEDIKFLKTQIAGRCPEKPKLSNKNSEIFPSSLFGRASMSLNWLIMQTKGLFMKSWSHVLSGMCNKPISCYKNCTKSPKEIGLNMKFMLCSVCKMKLDFIVHFCSSWASLLYELRHTEHIQMLSRTCQKQDWAKHKKVPEHLCHIFTRNKLSL